MKARRAAWLLLSLFVFVVIGCGDRLNRGGEISGLVTIDGQPVTAGNVLFVSEDGQYSVSGRLTGKGTYTVKEPPLGPCKIAIQTLHFRGRPAPGQSKTAAAKGAGSAGMVLPDPNEMGLVYKAIPEKYEKIETSGLTCTVERGNQKHDIPLTK